MKKKYTIPILVISVITTIASILLFIFFIKVIENKNKHTDVVLGVLQGKLKEKEDFISNASKIAEIKSLQGSIDGYFVNQNTVDVFVGYLEDIGTKLNSSISVNSIEIVPENPSLIMIKLSISGLFNDVIKTVSYLENIPYQISIKQIYLNQDSKKTESDGVKEGPKSKSSKNPTWQADVSFTILTL